VTLATLDWVLALGLASLLALLAWPGPLPDMPLKLALPILATALLVKGAIWWADVYADRLHKIVPARMFELACAFLAAWALAVWLFNTSLPPGVAAAATPLFVVAALISWTGHLVARAFGRALAKQGALAETAVIIGATDAARALIRRAGAAQELNVLGVFDDRLARAPAAVEGAPVLGTVDDLLAWEHLPDVDRIIISVTSTAEGRVRDLIARLRVLPNQVALLLDLNAVGAETANLGAVGHAPAAYVSGAPVNKRRATLKRAQDLILGGFITLVALPIMALIALAVKLDSPGPAMFRQQRHGFNNRLITVYKFRTMRHAPQAVGGPIVQVRANDSRVTRLGAFLRRTSLDELPQLFNVLKGEMSLVGPRPHAVGMRTGDVESHLLVAEYAHRHRMKPGMTGWAQINGSRGPMDSPDEVRERVRLDLDYIDRASFWLDLWIILATLPALLGDRLRTR
jgi:Undecaprenyl-phosphate glucose phosphotransferase